MSKPRRPRRPWRYSGQFMSRHALPLFLLLTATQAQEIPVTRTWGDLRAAPEHQVGDGLRVRLGVDKARYSKIHVGLVGTFNVVLSTVESNVFGTNVVAVLEKEMMCVMGSISAVLSGMLTEVGKVT